MARLTRDEWAEVRAEWEASPRQGLTWLLASAGGRWNITEEPLRHRRAAEGWTKRGGMVEVVRRARQGADRLSAASAQAEADAAAAGDVGSGEAEVGHDAPKTRAQDAAPAIGAAPVVAPAARPAGLADDAAVEMRTRLISMHRDEWKAARALVYKAMREGESAVGFDKAKFAKITTESLKNIQEGERRAWSLDADLIDFDAMTDAQLEALAKGRLPR